MKILYPLAKRFIAGDDFESAKPVIQKMIDEGYEVSIDYIGENSTTYTQCRKAYREYSQIIRELQDCNLDISIKPSQLGLNIHPYLSYIFLNNLARKAAKLGHTIRLDMEDSSVARQFEEHTRASFFDYAARLYSNKANKPAIATHDEELLDDINELIPNSNEFFDYEFLYGIRRDLQKKYKLEGRRVRIYIPFGTEWLPYTIRRLREWKNLKFVIKNIFKEWFK